MVMMTMIMIGMPIMITTMRTIGMMPTMTPSTVGDTHRCRQRREACRISRRLA